MKHNILKDKTNKRILGLTVYLIAVIFVAALLLHLMNDSDKTVFGYSARVVVSGSMEPVIKVNSISIVKNCDIEDIHENDIVCFKYSQDIIHRVIEVTTNDSGETVLHTKGDANELADNIEIYEDMVIGKVVYTFNGLADIVEKYSISPGQIDGVTLSRNIVLSLVILGLLIFVAMWLVSLISIIIKSFSKKNNLDDNIDKYINDIEELILYRDVLKELKENEVENSAETRFRFLANRVARAKAEVNIKELHHEIKNFKREIKHCIYINKLGSKLDDHTGEEK